MRILFLVVVKSKMSSTIPRKKYSRNRPDGPQCEICLKRFYGKSELRQHIDRLHNPNKTNEHECPTCHKRFSQRSHLNRHIRTIHNREKRFSCSFCGKRFGENRNLQQHVRSLHLGWRTAPCFQCGRTFTRDTDLLRHVEQVHERTIRRPRHCSKCDFVGATPNSLKVHFLARHSDTRFACAFGCDKSYSTCGNLGTLHLRKEHDKITCKYIRYAVAAKKYAPLPTPIKQQPIRCKLCPRSSKLRFATNAHLKRHIVTRHM